MRPSRLSREVLEKYLPLVRQIVGRMIRKLPPNVLRDDLIGAGTLGLVDALRKSPDKGSTFEWYARIRIRGAVLDELRAQDWLTRNMRIRVAKERAEGENPSVAVVSFDALANVADESASSPQEQVEKHRDNTALATALARLSEREARIIKWYYFEGTSFKSIARRLGVSEPRISQIHAKILIRMRSMMNQRERAEAA